MKIKSRTQKYADKWNENMFLNNFSKRDENAGTNIKLKDVYLESHLPHYIWKKNTLVSTDLKELLYECINRKQMLLILGQPAIGKSTLITWMVVNFIDKINNILVYQFASDLKNIDWYNISKGYELGNINQNNKEYNLLNELLKVLGIEYNNLNKRTLILDGFDEISVGNQRIEILNQLYWGLVKNNLLEDFSLIITCRENYIQDLYKAKCDYITLQSWDEEQIKSFCKVYKNKANSNISENTMKRVLKNKDIFGIPLILYMVLALNISIEEKGSVVDVYDQIFSLEGGIYDRCINNDSYARPHRIKQIKNQIHQISREIAIWMFENNPDEAYIPFKKYQKICSNIINRQGKKDTKEKEQDILIGSFFKLKHCEGIGTDKLYFIHRSIYEYFVIETIYNSIENAMKELSENSQEELAGNIAIYLKQGKITETIGEYLRYKIIKLYNRLHNKKKERFYQWWEKTIEKMMNIGMFYYTKRSLQDYRNIINKEIICFMNLIKILRLLMHIDKKIYIMESVDKKQLERYIKYCSIENKITLALSYMDLSALDLEGVKLIKADLRNANLTRTSLGGAYLRGTDLREANLRGTYLKRADLVEANLTKADLTGANLKLTNLNGANLKGINLAGANLVGAILDENQVNYLEDKYDLQRTKIYIGKTDKIITYQEYCNKKKEE